MKASIQPTNSHGALYVLGAFLVMAAASVCKAQQAAPQPVPNPPAANTPLFPAGSHGSAAQQPAQLATHSWQLRSVTAQEFENTLNGAWGNRLESSRDEAGNFATFRFPPAAIGAATMVVDRRTNLVTLSAPERVAGSWLKLVKWIDSPRQSADEAMRMVPLSRAEPATVWRAIRLVADAAAAGQPRRKRHIGEFVSLLFQQENELQPQNGFQQQPGFQPQPNFQQPGAPFAPPQQPFPAPPAEIGTAQLPPGTAIEALARIGNVQIEIVEDIIVVRGRQQDVQRVLEIIEQIEQQSLQTQPIVELYQLKHVDSRALNEMITQISTNLFARMGPVTIVPLARPNAVLLIGRREHIPAVIELIQKLDVPAPMDSEFRVFHLKHMSAIDAERTLRQFFVERPGFGTDPRTGLGSRVLVIAEYRANALIVQAAPRDMQEVMRIINDLDVEESGMKNEVQVFKLRNALADQLAPILQEAVTGLGPGGQQIQQQQLQGLQGGAAGGQASSPAIATRPSINLEFLQIDAEGQRVLRSGILANMRITADPGGNQLIVVGPSASMELMAALIEQLDALPGVSADVNVITLQNADATSLATMLQSLFGTGQQGAQGQQFAQTATGAGETTLVPLRFSVDTRTNSIIASGNQGDLRVVYQILARLDEAGVRQRDTRVYRLRNVFAQDAATALQNLLQQQLQLAQAAPDLISPLDLVERQVIVVPEIGTNSLILSASPRFFPEVMRIIEDLDRRPPMVVIQVVIAEVRLGDIHQFGVEWGLQDSLMFDRSIATNRFNFEGPGTTIMPNDNTPASLATRENVAGQALANFALGRVDPALGFGGLVLTASNESVSVLLRALEQSQRIQVLSRPQVQTLDNQLAYVQVGQNIARIQDSQINQFGGFTNTFEDIPVGIILQVQPRTSVDGMITMLINAEKSELGPEAEGTTVAVDAEGNSIRVAPINITRAQTTVSVRSGQTAILGGLITKSQTEVTRRVPYVADIPVLGRLFRFDQVIQDRTELLIIMTPYIVSSDEQIEWMNQRETERMSWCIADVVDIHGPVGISGNPMFNHGETPLIFPDLAPGSPTPAAPAPGAVPPATEPPAAPPAGWQNGYPPAPASTMSSPPLEASQRRTAAPGGPSSGPPSGPLPTAIQPALPMPQGIDPVAPPAVTQLGWQQNVPAASPLGSYRLPPGPPPAGTLPAPHPVAAAAHEQPLGP